MSIRTEERLSYAGYVLAVLLAAGYMGLGCSGGRHVLPPGKMISGTASEAAQLDEGRNLLVKYCAECHRRYNPSDRRPAVWKEILSRHRGRVSMTQEQFGKLEGYVIRASVYYEDNTPPGGR